MKQLKHVLIQETQKQGNNLTFYTSGAFIINYEISLCVM